MILRKYVIYIFMLLSLLGNSGNNGLLKAASPEKTFLEKMAERAEIEARNRAENHRMRMEYNQQDLERLHRSGAVRADHPDHMRYQTLMRNQGQAEKRLDDWHNLELDVNKTILGIASDHWHTEIEKGKIEAQRKTEVGKAFGASLAAQEGITERSKTMWEKLTDRKNIMLWSAALIGIPVTIYACKLGLDYASSKWGKPALVKETSRKSLKESVMGWFSKKKEVKVNFDDIVLAPELDKDARAFAERLKKQQQYKAPFQNLLLYGPPGTGKTEFAKKVAYYSGMDYALIDGGSFGQFKKGTGVTQINKLFDWAEKSPRGVVVFIDEIDAIAPDRGTITESDDMNSLNTLIARSGSLSRKVVLLGATNRRESLDSAMRKRLGRSMCFGLPEAPERAKILRKKIEMHIEQFEYKYDKNKPAIKLSCASDVTTDSFMTEMAGMMKQFSGRDIEKAVIDMQSEVLETDAKMLTKDIVKTIIVRWISIVAEDQKITAAQDRKNAARG